MHCPRKVLKRRFLLALSQLDPLEPDGLYGLYGLFPCNLSAQILPEDTLALVTASV